jgi:hypothetical protein
MLLENSREPRSVPQESALVKSVRIEKTDFFRCGRKHKGISPQIGKQGGRSRPLSTYDDEIWKKSN